MAQRVNIVLIDDIDESVAAETVSFALDGVNYEIDLNEEHAQQLRDALGPWVAKARREPGQRASRRRHAKANQGPSEAAKIRAWAAEKGIEVSDRGRIPAEIREQYLQATRGQN